MPSEIFHLKDGMLKHLYTGYFSPLSRVAPEVFTPQPFLHLQTKWASIVPEKTLGQKQKDTVFTVEEERFNCMVSSATPESEVSQRALI